MHDTPHIHTRVGTGYDVHAFAAVEAGRPLIVGGVIIPHERGLAGHSDADVLTHAVVDALLGAAALGDIGTYFPSSDARWQNAPSSDFLTHTVGLLRERGWRIGNVDATVVTERPRLTPHVAAMRAHLAQTMEIEVEQVSVKAKTTDGLGFTGRAEGMACYAVALIERDAAYSSQSPPSQVLP
jgi:2-C-methyl-D-erythritol 2,4-cyclodiphosphate synthase